MNHLTAYAKRGAYDDLHTPKEAITYLLPYLHDFDKDGIWPVIWESAPPRKTFSRLGRFLEQAGYQVVQYREDFFDRGVTAWPGKYGDVQVPNPPYSLKAQWILRSQEINMPTALLLPITTLGLNKKFPGVQATFKKCGVILLPHRLDFTGGKSPWFNVAWFTWGFPCGPGIHIAEDRLT